MSGDCFLALGVAPLLMVIVSTTMLIKYFLLKKMLRAHLDFVLALKFQLW